MSCISLFQVITHFRKMLLYFFEYMIPVLLVVVIYQIKQHQESILHHMPHCVNDGFFATPHPYAQLLGAKDVNCLFSHLPAFTLIR